MNQSSNNSEKDFFAFFKKNLSAKPKPEKKRFGSWSGPGKDHRDPMLLGEATDKLVKEKNWTVDIAGEKILADWPNLVGREIAEHTKVINIENHVLQVEAISTAWATQLRLIQSQIISKINEKFGDGTIRMMKIRGPLAPSWRKGKRHVSGRGPRDTYG